MATPEGNPHSEKNRELPTISSTLLQQIQDMQPGAWGRLVQVFGPIVYRWCRQSGVPSHDASDIVQEVFSSVSRGITNFHRSQEGQSFRNWLATISRNRIRDYYRRQAKAPTAQGGTEALQAWQNMPDPIEESLTGDQLDGEISRRVMELVRAEFEERTWLAFHKTVVEGQLPASVARDLDMNVASVYQA